MAALKKQKRAAASAKKKATPKKATLPRKTTPKPKRAAARAKKASAEKATSPKKATPKPKPKPKRPAPRPTAATRAPKRRSIAKITQIEKPNLAVVVTDADAIPRVLDNAFSPSGRKKTAKDWSSRSSPVVEILDDPHPIGALRRFLESVEGATTDQQAEIALGSAQLLLLPIARESRGGPEVKELLDLVLHRWSDFGERRIGFHAQEFLRNAFAAVGVDRDRIAQLQAAVPEMASVELLFEIACAYAVARDKVAMLRAVEVALAASATPAQFRREPDFAPYVTDPDLAVLLARADLPQIPVDVDPYRTPVRIALDSLLLVLEELGGQVELRPPARLDTILDAERAAKVSLPNDYRAFLSITNGMRLLDREFLATADYRDPTSLAQRAHHFVHAEYAAGGLSDCVPLASWGRPEDWLLYDPRGRVRGGAPGYLATSGKDEIILDDLVAALGWLEELTRDILGTN